MCPCLLPITKDWARGRGLSGTPTPTSTELCILGESHTLWAVLGWGRGCDGAEGIALLPALSVPYVLRTSAEDSLLPRTSPTREEVHEVSDF